MPALPSFVELMSSLGLAADASGSSSPSLSSSSPSQSPQLSAPLLQVPAKTQTDKENTPAIVVSHPKNAVEKGESKRRTSSGNTKASRYSPYAPAARRGSSSSTSDSKSDSDSAMSSSSRRSNINRDASSGLTITERRALRRLHVAATPISSFARRHSPHASPTSPGFALQRPRAPSASLPSPVMLPTLPPTLAQSLSAFAFPGTSNEKRVKEKSDRRSRSPVPSPMVVDSDSGAFVKQNPAGLRISSFHRQVAPIA